VNCADMAQLTLTHLFEKAEGQDDPIQDEEGEIVWPFRFRVSQNRHSFYFFVERASVIKLYFNTLESGVFVDYQVTDDRQQIVFKGSGYREQENFIGILRPSKVNKFEETPFQIHLKFNYKKQGKDQDCCFIYEQFLALQPFDKLEKSLKCTPGEETSSRQSKKTEFHLGYQPLVES